MSPYTCLHVLQVYSENLWIVQSSCNHFAMCGVKQERGPCLTDGSSGVFHLFRSKKQREMTREHYACQIVGNKANYACQID